MPERSATPDVVEVVRSFAESVPRDPEEFLGFFAPEAVWQGVQLGSSFHGVAEIRTFLTDWMGAYDKYEIRPREVHDLGAGVVIAVVDQVTRLSGATAEMSELWAFVFAWIDGRIVRVITNSDIEEARTAAEGLAGDRAQAASEENVEIVRRAYEHRRATGDFLEAVLAHDFVWDMSTFRGWPEQQTYVGIEEARRFIREWTGAFEGWQIEIESIRAAGLDKVVGIVRQRGRAKSSGLPVDMRLGQVFTLRDGMETRMEMYSDPAEALRAVGLED